MGQVDHSSATSASAVSSLRAPDSDLALQTGPNAALRLLRNCVVTNSSGCHRYGYWNEQALFDGSPRTGWCTPSRKVRRVEFLEIDFGRTAAVCTMRLLSRTINPKAGFPGLVRILVPRDTGWEETAAIRTAPNDTDVWHQYEVPRAPTTRWRIEFDEIALRPEGKYFLQFMCLELYEAAQGVSS
ncbi:hypothetical protein with galactose-binding domain (plasmid) [Afipia carboxidovorans OM5]|uniref:F5/8 type C domain-containing protein n=1 Tax=Afipia carboxidovorans (strain ATCC 49405 / DSM 1227 / KCTC 32145 / OM5) TaxID=504832 RepID=F8C0X6_AFIC5|nr:discoidin domain-containing protein [Afipia carboxidovorans]AEI04458.1 hypothetical protein with galactose-binding domain [Afipia carboxidovorans OM4]AEI08086.1 hypothetical protein with galactose-binding domain [Afipia carboxidovorans OM5]